MCWKKSNNLHSCSLNTYWNMYINRYWIVSEKTAKVVYHCFLYFLWMRIRKYVCMIFVVVNFWFEFYYVKKYNYIRVNNTNFKSMVIMHKLIYNVLKVKIISQTFKSSYAMPLKMLVKNTAYYFHNSCTYIKGFTIYLLFTSAH